MPRGLTGVSVAVLVAILAFGCTPSAAPDKPGPVVVVGVDGGSWQVIRRLWEEGRLPHLRALSERGVVSDLMPVASASPVIWTSMATGVRPERHGIEGFVVPTERGPIPVSSALRKVPALWNMATVTGRRVAVLGWWASWPAEEVNGIVASDRPFGTGSEAFYPADLEVSFTELAERHMEEGTQIPRHFVQDGAMGRLAVQSAGEDFDLILVYQRTVDMVSHRYWRYFRRNATETNAPADVEKYGPIIPAAYEDLDRLVGELVEAGSPDTNLFVVSDHGFHAMKGPQVRVSFDMNGILRELGYQRLDESGAIEWSESVAMSLSLGTSYRVRPIQVGPPGGALSEAEAARIESELRADLERLRWGSGQQAFRVRRAKREERERGADLEVVVLGGGATQQIFLDGEALRTKAGVRPGLSGSHGARTRGIFLAAGPAIDETAELELIHTLDVAPTILAAMGLPVGEDFDGSARLEIFRSTFLERYPLRTISSWGGRDAAGVVESPVDEELVEELKSLGYLN